MTVSLRRAMFVPATFIALALLIPAAPSVEAAEFNFDVNLIQNAGFESTDPFGEFWTFSSGVSVQGQSARTDSIGLTMNNASSTSTSAIYTANQSLTDLQGNRRYRGVMFLREPEGDVSTLRTRLGAEFITTQNGETAGFASNTPTFTLAGSGLVDTFFGFDYRNVVGGRSAFIDDVALYRERAQVVVTGDSVGGELTVGQQTVVSLFSPGAINSNDIMEAFDNDVQVVSSNASIDDVTWISDSQLDVTLTALALGEVDLTVANVFSDRQDIYTMQAVPEPASLALLASGALLIAVRRRRSPS